MSRLKIPPIKLRIKNNFEKASTDYDSVAAIQKRSAELLVSNLLNFAPSFYPKTILDLGSGTGYVPEILLKYYPESIYNLNDVAPGMLQISQHKFRKYSNFNFCQGDMDQITFNDHELIISNMALQWTQDMFSSIRTFYHKADILAFSCLIDGTFCEWFDILKNYGINISNNYPAEKELIEYCQLLSNNRLHRTLASGREFIGESERKTGLYLRVHEDLSTESTHKLSAEVECTMKSNQAIFMQKDFIITLSDAYSFMIYLKKLGANTSDYHVPHNIIKTLIHNYKQELTITYRIFFAVMKNTKLMSTK